LTAEQYQVNINVKGDRVAHNHEHPFSVDIDEFGTRSFNVNLWTMPNAAEERTSPAGGKHSVVVAALGDALANTHFYSGGGMNTGMSM
jgi:2-polyprenyl-6-methoxyphenol hydroxylase-like FAD-dependent oxidoreductase